MKKRALVICPDIESRFRIKRMLERSSLLGQVDTLPSMTEATEKQVENESYDYYVFDHSLPPDKVAVFIEKVKRISGAKKPTNIMILGKEEQDSATVSTSMMIGIHAFLCEPLSLDSIDEALSLGSSANLNGTQMRLKAATGLILTEMLEEMTPERKDLVGKHIPLDERVNNSYNLYKEITGQSLTVAIVNDLNKLPAQHRLPEYKGVSSRVRQIFEKQIKRRLAELFKRAGGAAID